MTTHTLLARAGAGSVAAALLLASSAMLASAQTTLYSSSTTPGGTGAANTTSSTSGTGTTQPYYVGPGAPNTGAGGDAAANLALLAVAGLAAVGGATYLARRGAMARA